MRRMSENGCAGLKTVLAEAVESSDSVKNPGWERGIGGFCTEYLAWPRVASLRWVLFTQVRDERLG